jgi:hypothetical protein
MGQPPAPAKPGAKPAPAPDWQTALSEAGQNLVPSAQEGLGAMASAVLHPGRTIGAIGQVGQGLFSQAAGALGMQQDPKEKAKTEALAQTLESHYAQAYGGLLHGDTSGFRQAIATDPFSVLMDASTFLPAVGMGTRVAGLGRVAEGVGRVASAVDPLQNAMRVGRIVASPVMKLARVTSSAFTGVPEPLLKVASQAGATADPVLRGAFMKFFNGQGDAAEYLQTAQRALDQVKQDASDAYMARKGALSAAAPSFAKVDQAMADARGMTQLGGPGTGAFKSANSALDDAQQLIDAYKTNPKLNSLEGFDNLKQALWDLRDGTGNAVAQRHLGGLYNSVKEAITDVDPAYADLMDTYQTARAGITDMQRTLGTARNAAATSTLAKNLRALKTQAGQNLFSQLAAKEPTLPYMLAGHALEPWVPGGLRNIAELPLAFLGLSHFGPGAVAAQFLGTSPKVAGLAAMGAGRAGALVAPVARGAYWAGRAGEEAPVGTTAGPAINFGNFSPADVDAATRMVIAEAGNQADIGKSAAIHTAMNVANATGKSLGDVINMPREFETVTTGATGRVNPASKLYAHVRDNIVLPALQGKSEDPTGGAVHFINKSLQRRMGRPMPKWAQGEGQQIGDHTFYKHLDEGGRVERASGGKVEDGEHLVDRLFDAVKAAKRAEKHTTKPMLKLPDNQVADALAIARRAL